MVASPQPDLTVQDYLHLEAASPTKHEYIDGAAYAMAGASDAHVTITVNLAALLRSHVRGSGCRVYIADLKARIEARNCFYYPDVMVTCDERDRENDMYKCFPKLIVEVLSESTEAFDRGDKFADYQSLETLEEYVLVNTRHRRVECFHRNEAGLWVLRYHTEGEFTLASLNFSAPLAALYEDVELG
ncbi:MAG TPA: Uma2 family endonuclease [Leptolyngbyaceae cyanobacterium M65_K2018_010]|nr:Uma2 family endonuclease [Leptolyngbyaceae cyanobacterium M65_K2018_010]